MSWLASYEICFEFFLFDKTLVPQASTASFWILETRKAPGQWNPAMHLAHACRTDDSDRHVVQGITTCNSKAPHHASKVKLLVQRERKKIKINIITNCRTAREYYAALPRALVRPDIRPIT